MPNNIPGITDFIPALQPYQPDLNFYSNVLQAKQSQYDAGYAKISGLYGSVLNSPMVRDDNNSRRDKFLKAVDQDIKKVSGLDLSKQENINAANIIFKPFYDDKNIIHDIAFTNKYQGELSKAESFRNCIDPDKCGGAYWDTGVQAMHYKADEYKNADSQAALAYNAPRFTPYVNVTKKAIEVAKSAGFKVEIDHKEKGYIVTDTNGKLLLGDGQKAGPLPQFLYGMFGQDQSVLDMFNTQAYVQRKSFIKQNAEKPEFGSEDAAESFYLNNFIKDAVPVLEKNATQSQAMLDELTVKKKILEERAAQMGGVIKGSNEESSLELINALLENSGTVKQYHEGVLNEIKTAPNLNDLKALRVRADSLVANTLLQGTLNTAAFDYAMGTAKREMKADPYDLERFRTAQDIYSHKQNAMTDLGVWAKKMEYEKLEGTGAYKPASGGKVEASNIAPLLRSRGLDPKTATPSQIKAVIDEATAGDLTKPIVAAGGIKLTTGYADNLKVFATSMEDVNGHRERDLITAVEVMKAKYGALVQTGLPDKLEKANQIQKELGVMFQGTGINSSNILNGNQGITRALEGKSPVVIAGSFGKMTALMNDPASLWGNDVKNSPELAQTIKDQSAVSLIAKTMKGRVKNAVEEAMIPLRFNLKKGAITQEEFTFNEKVYGTMIKDGLFVPQKTAAEEYANNRLGETVAAYNKVMADRLKNSGVVSAPTMPMLDEKALKAQYTNDFNNSYNENRAAVENLVASMTAPVGTNSIGGSLSEQAASMWSVNSNVGAVSDIPATRLAEAFSQGLGGVVTTKNTLEDLSDDPKASREVKKYLQQYLENKGKAGENLGFTVTAEQIGAMKYTDGGKEVQPGVVYKVAFSLEGAKKLLGKDYDADSDYSYNIYYENKDDPNQLAEKTKKSPTDIALSIKGNSLSVPLVSGNISVTNSGKNYEISGSYSFYNPYKKAYETQSVSGQAPITDSPSKLIDQTVTTLNKRINALTPQANALR